MSLEKIGKLKNAILMGIVAVIVFSTSAYASGLLSSNKTAMNTTGVIATAAVGVYSDAAATQNMTSINWGTCYPGSNYTYVVYVKNLGTVDGTLSLQAANWNPSAASNYITLTSDYGGQALTLNQVLKVTFTLKVSSSITQITSFDFDIVVTSQG